MARVWLLVEWVDEDNVFTSYGVVNIDSFAYQENELNPGKEILICLNLHEPRRAKIIRLSDNKQNLQEHKDFLERQDKQVKNVLALCMRTIKEMKSEQFTNSNENVLQACKTNQQNAMLHIVSAKEEDNLSDNEVEVSNVLHYTQPSRSNMQINVSHSQLKQESLNNHHKNRLKNQEFCQRRQSMKSSTPLPVRIPQDDIKLCFDQGTQTDNSLMQPPLEKIEEIETVLKHLYGRFQHLIANVNISTNICTQILEPETNDTVSPFEITSNKSYVETNNIIEPLDDDNIMIDQNNSQDIENGIKKEQYENRLTDGKMNGKNDDRGSKNDSLTRVRRMSAQTTNSLDMVPIGDGNAMVPARLLNDIDWNSHTYATRQLLQAIFSRKVLATHSLTGKQSPAHLNKPPKKILDPALVDDIVKTVSTRCGVPKNLVRNSITIKCTDEAKLYRNRQKYQQKRKENSRQNLENIPPSRTPSSDGSNLSA